MPLYHYTVTVFAAQRTEPYETSGTITADSGTFPDVVQSVLRQSFHDLTAGRAQFGDPATCTGPYQIRRLVIERFDA